MTAPSPDWQDRGACHSDADLFFGADGETREERDRRVSLARAICIECPVRADCLQFAVSTRVRFGVWGGRDFEEPDPRRMCRNNRHLMDDQNTSVDPGGVRNCRACREEGRERARQRKQQEGGVAA